MIKYGALIETIDFYNLLAEARKVHGPYHRRDGRQIVIIVNDDGSRRTVSYPKFLVEEHLGRQLDPDLETIDHMDSNFDNNDITNLRIVPRKEHSGDDTRRVKPVEFTCAMCKNTFQRSPRLVRDKAKKKKAGPFCSRSCAGKYSRKLQLKLIDKMDVQPVIDSVYYKRKYVKASLIDPELLIDYLCDVWPEG